MSYVDWFSKQYLVSYVLPILLRFFVTLFLDSAVSPMRDSSSSSTMTQNSECSKSTNSENALVFSVWEQARGALETLEKEIALREYTVKIANLYMEKASASFEKAICDSKASEEEEADVPEEIIPQVLTDMGALVEVEAGKESVLSVIEEHSRLDREEQLEDQQSDMADERVATTHEDELLQEKDIVGSESVNSDDSVSSNGEDEVGVLEDIGLQKPNGLECGSDSISDSGEVLEENGLHKSDGFVTSVEDEKGKFVASESGNSDAISLGGEDELGALGKIGLQKPNGFDDDENGEFVASDSGYSDTTSSGREDEIGVLGKIGMQKPNGFDEDEKGGFITSESSGNSDTISSSGEDEFSALGKIGLQKHNGFDEEKKGEFVGSESSSRSDTISSSSEDELGVLGLQKPSGFDEEDRDIMEQLKELEELCKTDDLNSKWPKPEGEGKPIDGFDHNLSPYEILQEHQEFMEQLKMELKKLRPATRLLTIIEESESNIDEQYQHVDDGRVLRKSCRIYREQMWKLDNILNKKKLDSISFSGCKSSSAIKSLLSKFKLCRPNKDTDPIVDQFISDLEVVYVGQLCLSWEILQWQYEKAMTLRICDPNRTCSYYKVAKKFQDFQVLLERFVENEPFEGARPVVPRVEIYAKHRRMSNLLLQVPVVREDKKVVKDNAATTIDILVENGEKDKAITIDILVEKYMKEAIQTIWRFIQADKDASRKRSLVGDCLDPKLLSEVQADLREKKRNIKELLRDENPILKRILMHGEEKEGGESEDHHLLLCSRVYIKIVSRVLNMQSVTQDQLKWCQNKLKKIHVDLYSKKIHVDHSFLPFPC